jgi:hypothetical protein
MKILSRRRSRPKSRPVRHMTDKRRRSQIKRLKSNNQIFRVHFIDKKRTPVLLTPEQRYSIKFLSANRIDNINFPSKMSKGRLIRGINNIDNNSKAKGSRSISLYNQLIKDMKKSNK